MNDIQKKNRKTLLVTLSVVAAMIILSFASVPLYRKICQVTGWGGTTQELAQNPFTEKDHGREITVRFNADVAMDMPWDFKPEMVSVKVRLGQDGFIVYKARNLGKTAITGTAVYNVTPLEAGKYFYKTQCFCFGEQTLAPGEEVNMPVSFFVDPKILEDYDMRNIKTITLSYTFYRQDSAALEKAVENFINTSDNSASDKTLN